MMHGQTKIKVINLYSTFGWAYFVVLLRCSRQIP